MPDGRRQPCDRCNGACYDLWRAGHFEPDHYCDVCRPRGRRTPEPKTSTPRNRPPERADVDG